MAAVCGHSNEVGAIGFHTGRRHGKGVFAILPPEGTHRARTGGFVWRGTAAERRAKVGFAEPNEGRRDIGACQAALHALLEPHTNICTTHTTRSNKATHPPSAGISFPVVVNFSRGHNIVCLGAGRRLQEEAAATVGITPAVRNFTGGSACQHMGVQYTGPALGGARSTGRGAPTLGHTK